MGRIGDIETKSLSARVPMETYIHFLATASKNKQTISSYLCDVLINVSANRKPQSFENGGITREQLLDANSQAFKGAERLRGTIKNQTLQLNEQSETIGQLRKQIAEIKLSSEIYRENAQANMEISIREKEKQLKEVLKSNERIIVEIRCEENGTLTIGENIFWKDGVFEGKPLRKHAIIPLIEVFFQDTKFNISDRERLKNIGKK